MFSDSVQNSLRLLLSNIESRYAKCHRIKSLFFLKHSKWLDSNFKILNNIPKKNVGGRKKISFGAETPRTRLRKTKDLREKHTTAELVSATVTALRTDGYRSVAWVVEHLFAFPEKASRFKKLALSVEPEMKRFTVDDALRFLCENDLTKQQYQNIRNMTLKKGYDIYPAYNDIRDNKSTCYPRGKDKFI